MPFQKTVAVVKPQNARGDLANPSLRLYHGFFQSEMLAPSVNPRIEEPAELTGPALDRPNVTPFLTVADGTGIR
jgi:hypothetical protein